MMTPEEAKALENVLVYLADEYGDYQAQGCPPGHIYESVSVLAELLPGREPFTRKDSQSTKRGRWEVCYAESLERAVPTYITPPAPGRTFERVEFEAVTINRLISGTFWECVTSRMRAATAAKRNKKNRNK